MLSELALQANFQSINLYAEAHATYNALALDKTVQSNDTASMTALVKFWRNKGEFR
jgi:hypothetical protein